MELYTKQELGRIVYFFEQGIAYKRAKPTYELDELVKGGYVIPKEGTYTFEGKELNCIYYNLTPKGFRVIHPQKKLPKSLGGAPDSQLVKFTGYTMDFCKKYLYDEPYLTPDGLLSLPYSQMYQVLKGNKFYKCENEDYFRVLNKHLFNMDTAGCVSAETWHRVLKKVNERVDISK